MQRYIFNHHPYPQHFEPEDYFGAGSTGDLLPSKSATHIDASFLGTTPVGYVQFTCATPDAFRFIQAKAARVLSTSGSVMSDAQQCVVFAYRVELPSATDPLNVTWADIVGAGTSMMVVPIHAEHGLHTVSWDTCVPLDMNARTQGMRVYYGVGLIPLGTAGTLGLTGFINARAVDQDIAVFQPNK